ncbi:MAG: hypothetical protein H8E55_08375, partial [Pelagibacterales bacterium]|nr:hypothetical protein [Pelagibacterales bacterium]
NLEYLKQVPTEYGVVDFYLPDHNMYIEIDGDYWHPTSYEELNFQTLGNAINDNRKSNISNLYRIREGNVANIETIDDIFKFNHIYDFNIGYRQKIITKEYLSRKNYKKYIWLLLKFIRQFQPTFPFPATEETVSYVLKNIPDKIDNILVDDTFYNNRTSNIGVSYLKSNFKSYWNSKYKGNQTPVDIYNNDTAMKRIIRYRIGDNKSRETFDFSLHQIIRGISAIRGTISFFKPALAAAIYKHFLRDIKSPTVIDPCAGFGGRMLGFKSIYPEGKYIGIEPNPDTFKELQILAEGFDNIELHNCRLEDYSGSKECDLTFTSIPYYDTEIYSTHIEYKTIDEWKSTFIKQLLTFKNLTINVPANLRNCFDKNVVEYRLVNNTSHLNKCKNEKTEYILKIK